MPSRRLRRQYQQPLEYENGRIIGLTEAGRSAQRIGLVGLSDLTTGRRVNHRIMRHSSVEPITSSAAVHKKTAPSLRASVSSRTITRRLGMKDSIIAAPIMCAANDTHPQMPPFRVVSRMTGLDCNEMEPRRL
ncbi:hypothetical protein TNCV_3367271 [Trichonephila clavipes]|nr:hypothetical protein TNCV_3367271 [Trichonephila clavipes]